MEQENEDLGKKFKRNILIGSFLGGLVGVTIAMILFPQSKEERKKKISQMQGELVKPIKTKFNELIEHIGDSLIKAIDEASKKAAEDNNEDRT
ncbi:hypothetical protein MCHI_001805 [Candidatus Magnetoovum chiemensis]|nr:hypothetical protein MCHI_001805 [Candidatus Magnetoovum chiemensis]